MRPFSPYALGETALIAYQQDPRFSYAMIVPPAYDKSTANEQEFDLVISMHGSIRTVHGYRAGFRDLAKRRGCWVIAPLFPIAIEDPYDADNYKYIEFRGIRYDLILLGMIAEVERMYGVRFKRRALHGYSGGGQFAHRFFLLHPTFLDAVSIGAPGKVTVIDQQRPWWVGTSDVEERFRIRLNIDAMKATRILMVVGDKDRLEEDVITLTPSSRLWMDGANSAGKNRVERLKSLHANFESHGVRSELRILDDIQHDDGLEVIPTAAAFIENAWF